MTCRLQCQAIVEVKWWFANKGTTERYILGIRAKSCTLNIVYVASRPFRSREVGVYTLTPIQNGRHFPDDIFKFCIIWKCIKGTLISVYGPLRRNIILMNSPSIKMTSGKHGTLLKVSFVRIKWNRNIRAFFTDKGQQITGDKNIADKFNEYLHKSDRVWQIQLISPIKQLLTLILRNQTLLLFNFSTQMHLVYRKS